MTPEQKARIAAPRQYFIQNGERIAFLTAGNPKNPPLVMVHGWFSHAEVWRGTIDMLCDRYFCIAVDLLGLALSDKPDDADYSVPAHAKRLLALVDSLGIEDFALIGHSLGGQISLYIASVLAPERVTTLIDVAGVATGRLGWYVENVIYPRLRMAVNALWLWDLIEMMLHRFPRYAKLEFHMWFYDMNRLPYDSWKLDRIMAFDRSMHLSTYRIGQGIRALDLTPYLHCIRARTLVIFGTDDAVVPPHQGKLVSDSVRGSKLALIDQCGHFPMYECKDAYLKEIETFLG
jgi:pimeloyl-ACP methyl ester carboxylesterase